MADVRPSVELVRVPIDPEVTVSVLIDSLSPTTRSQVRWASWALIVSGPITLTAIFGMGAGTGAGDYFSDDPSVAAAAIADYNTEIWILLIGTGLGMLALGAALFLLGRVFAQSLEGPWSTVSTVAAWLSAIVAVIAAAQYFRGPMDPSEGESSLDSLFLAVFAVLCGAFILYGLLMIRTSMPTWAGVVSIVVGGIMPWGGFLPLWWFVAGLAVGIALLRWRSRTVAAPGMA